MNKSCETMLADQPRTEMTLSRLWCAAGWSCMQDLHPWFFLPWRCSCGETATSSSPTNNLCVLLSRMNAATIDRKLIPERAKLLGLVYGLVAPGFWGFVPGGGCRYVRIVSSRVS